MSLVLSSFRPSIIISQECVGLVWDLLCQNVYQSGISLVSAPYILIPRRQYQHLKALCLWDTISIITINHPLAGTYITAPPPADCWCFLSQGDKTLETRRFKREQCWSIFEIALSEGMGSLDNGPWECWTFKWSRVFSRHPYLLHSSISMLLLSLRRGWTSRVHQYQQHTSAKVRSQNKVFQLNIKWQIEERQGQQEIDCFATWMETQRFEGMCLWYKVIK